MPDRYESVIWGLDSLRNHDDDVCDKAIAAIEYITYLHGIIAEKNMEIFGLRYMPEVKRVAAPLDIPTSRGTTHSQLMQMQHEAETMHDNPPHDQPMG